MNASPIHRGTFGRVLTLRTFAAPSTRRVIQTTRRKGCVSCWSTNSRTCFRTQLGIRCLMKVKIFFYSVYHCEKMATISRSCSSINQFVSTGKESVSEYAGCRIERLLGAVLLWRLEYSTPFWTTLIGAGAATYAAEEIAKTLAPAPTQSRKRSQIWTLDRNAAGNSWENMT